MIYVRPRPIPRCVPNLFGMAGVNCPRTPAVKEDPALLSEAGSGEMKHLSWEADAVMPAQREALVNVPIFLPKPSSWWDHALSPV